MEYNRLLMHTKNLLELVDAGIPCSTSFPEYIIAKKEIEEDERARQREVRPDASPIQPKITWGDVYEGRVKLPKIPKK